MISHDPDWNGRASDELRSEHARAKRESAAARSERIPDPRRCADTAEELAVVLGLLPPQMGSIIRASLDGCPTVCRVNLMRARREFRRIWHLRGN